MSEYIGNVASPSQIREARELVSALTVENEILRRENVNLREQIDSLRELINNARMV